MAIIPLMSTDDDQKTISTQSSSIGDLISAMKSVDVNSEEAKINETSIKDANGKRIELVDDPKSN